MALADFLPFQSPAPPPRVKAIWRAQRSLTSLTILGIVFRSEIAPLLATHVLALLAMRRIVLKEAIVSGAIGVVTGLLLTVPLDSFFWNKYPEWPELTSFLFNVIQGKSSDWGVSPFHFYFSSALPRLLLNPAVYVICIPVALLQPALQPSAKQLLAPNILFVALFSILPHKERRFVIYILPPLTTVAALGANWIWNRRNRTFFYRIGSAILVFSVAFALLSNIVMLVISSMNYPGGQAMYALHRVTNPTAPKVHVHLDTLTVMTGATRFMELESEADKKPKPKARSKRLVEKTGPLWVYDKTEQRDKTGNLTFWNSFDFALAELPERLTGDWDILEVVEGYDGVQILGPDEPARSLGSGRLAISWAMLVQVIRQRITRGRWAQIRMRPLIHVLRNKQRNS
jgi:alpha-1,6-mannosyltransferase